ncbi:TPA: hypothetical protein ACT5CI_001933 [Edwardsiella tarda]
MTTITKEFAQAIIKGHGYGVAPSAVEELARIALASLETESVIPGNIGPAMAKEEAFWLGAILNDDEADIFSDGWNACRAAMLKAVDHTNLADHSGDTTEKVELVSESRNTPAPQQEAK